jgi:hypothetical protein
LNTAAAAEEEDEVELDLDAANVRTGDVRRAPQQRPGARAKRARRVPARDDARGAARASACVVDSGLRVGAKRRKTRANASGAPRLPGKEHIALIGRPAGIMTDAERFAHDEKRRRRERGEDECEARERAVVATAARDAPARSPGREVRPARAEAPRFAALPSLSRARALWVDWGTAVTARARRDTLDSMRRAPGMRAIASAAHSASEAQTVFVVRCAEVRFLFMYRYIYANLAHSLTRSPSHLCAP